MSPRESPPVGLIARPDLASVDAAPARAAVPATVHLSLVVPVHNGAERLPEVLAELALLVRTRSQPMELVLVDDGSGPEAQAILDDFAAREPGVRVLRHENHGKGFSVARGLSEARGRYRIVTDADLAYPVEEALQLLQVMEQGGDDVAIACRVLPESRYLMSPAFFHYLFTRHLMSRALNLVVRLLLLPGILDTQAGLKGMSEAAARDLAPRLTIHGFAFDIELLMAARRRGFRIRQVPVFVRYDSEPTTVKFARDAFRMARDLLRIRWRAWRGRYD